MNCVPVVILGAPRSGTNILRDVLTSLPGVATWPCDEINHVWRYRNAAHPSDELPATLAAPKIIRYIRRQFDWVGRQYNAEVVVEKTCANCLRTDFVHKVLPGAKYIFIKRHGIDAAVSAVKKWGSPPDWMYLARKARFVPLRDIPFYLYRYILDHVLRFRASSRVGTRWGPVMRDADELLERCTPLEFCAIQWARCVDSADRFMGGIDRRLYYEVAYEDFVSDPLYRLEEIVDFLNLDKTMPQLMSAVSEVNKQSVGRGIESIDDADKRRIVDVAGNTLRKLGYISS